MTTHTTPATAGSANTSTSSTTSTTSAASGGPSDDGNDGDVGSQATEDFLERHPWVVEFGRIGWAAKGIVYLLIGVLAFVVAASPLSEGSGDEQVDQNGAIAKIAEQPFGTILLWAMAIGLLLYSLWRFVTVILPAGTDSHAILRRVGYAVSGLTYVTLAFTAISLARRPGSSGEGESQDAQVSGATADVLAWSGGRFLVGLAGLVVIGVGAYFLHKGVTASFTKQLEHRQVGPFSWKVVRAMGRAGWIGRAAMMALIGVFVTRAAIEFDPNEARGLDASLREVASSSIGMVLVYLVAVGLVLYGAFCVISTPIRKLVATDEDAVS